MAKSEREILMFQAMLDKAGVQYFTAEEIFFRGASDVKLKLNSDPPRALWKNIIPTVLVADEARRRLGKPIKITSAFRNLAYNRAIGSGPRSQHVQFKALDLWTTAPATLYKILLDLRREKFAGVSGGLGLYRTFCHVDCRPYPATWRG